MNSSEHLKMPENEMNKNRVHIVVDYSLKNEGLQYGILMNFLYYYGFLKTNFTRKIQLSSMLIPILLHVAYADCCVFWTGYSGFNWKLITAYTLGSTLRIMSWYAMYFKKTEIMPLLKQIDSITIFMPPNWLNGIFIALCFLSPVREFLFTFYIYYNNHEAFFSNFFYGFKVNNSLLTNAILLFIKLALSRLIPLIMELLILVLYLYICIRISETISSLSKQVEETPDFTFTSVQNKFINKYLFTLRILDSVQRVFSLPIFCICLYHIVMLFAKTSAFVLLDIEAISIHLAINRFSRILFSSSALFSVFYIAGKIPLSIADFKKALFRKLTNISSDRFGNSADLAILRDIINSSDVIMSGCGVLFYTKEQIPAAIGAFITYSLLLVNLN